jgi:glycosyltransferase involved in cell wall biosynthesis
MKEFEKLPVLIFNAVTPKLNGGVKRFVEELLHSFKSHNLVVCDLIGRQNKGILNNCIKLLQKYLNYLQEVEVVHFVVLSPYNVPFIIMAKIFQKKIIATYHGIYSEESSLIKNPHVFIPFWFADKTYRLCANMIISPSQYLLDKMKISKNIIVIPNPFNPDSLQNNLLNSMKKKSNNDIIFVTASNFNIKKKSDGLHFLFEAMNSLKEDFNSVKLLVFGDGIHLKNIKSKYKNFKNIIFMGFRTDFRDFLSNSDAYFHLSGLDNQPYSVIEAIMLGKVILCNDHGGLVETIDPNNNYVVQLDQNAITKGINKLIFDMKTNRELFQEKGERNRRFAIERYSTEVIATKYLTLYRDVISSD